LKVSSSAGEGGPLHEDFGHGLGKGITWRIARSARVD
jgi:hypothetical protein